MKELINYYYNFDIEEVEEKNNFTSFLYRGEEYYFVFFNRTEEELKDLLEINYELNLKGFMVHEIIMNRLGTYLVKVGDVFYILLKIKNNKDEIISFINVCENLNKLKLNNSNSKLFRNNWAMLWSKKVDYFEYQIKELGKNKNIIIDSFSYYIGLAENAISYVNKINKVIGISKFDNIVLSHRRIFYPNTNLNYLNPLSFIFDLEVRDIAEYLKIEFFNNEDSLLDLKTILKMHNFTPYSYHMLYARLLYPTYYFDAYEEVMNTNGDENKIIAIVNKVDDYELFLKEAYFEISKYVNLERVDWLIKKEL